MAGDSPDFDTILSEDLKERVARNLRENPGMSPQAAMLKAQEDRVKNRPDIPPAHGCPVNDLPPELLAHIFELGRQIYEEEEYEDDYEDEGLDLDDEWETDSEEGEADEEVVEDSDVRMVSPDKRTATHPHRSSAMISANGVPPDTDEEGSGPEEGSEFEDEEPGLPFQVLVSQVCRHWREIALGTHTLWTTLEFNSHLNVEKAQAWLERSNGLPLDIIIDCTSMHSSGHDEEDPDHPQTEQTAETHPATILLSFDHTTGTLTTSAVPPIGEVEEEAPQPCISLEDLIVIMDMITPHVQQWRVLEVSVSYYTYMYEVLSRLAQCPSAPLLEELGLYDYEDSDEYEKFTPENLATSFLPFHGIAPKLTHAAFWGVHVAWDESLSYLKGLRELEFAYHAKDVRPTFETFRAIIDASPDLSLLSLCLSGPTGDMEVVELPALRNLVLCYLEQDFARPLMRALNMPLMEDLTLDLHDEDFTEFVKQIAVPGRGQSRSLLAGLTSLKLTNLPCNIEASEVLMAQLEDLKKFDLKVNDEEEEWFRLLKKMNETETKPLYCPKLETVRVAGLEGSEVRRMVAARKNAGVSLSKLFISDRDFVDPKDEKWLRANVETLDFFSPSDSEDEEVVEVDDEEMDTDGN